MAYSINKKEKGLIVNYLRSVEKKNLFKKINRFTIYKISCNNFYYDYNSQI